MVISTEPDMSVRPRIFIKAVKNDKSKRERSFKLISGDSKFEAAYYNKGVCENELSKYKEAASTLSTLLQKDPSYSKAYFQRGRGFYPGH